ncbi:hypothetical protein CcaCcLH18_08693 [Colletotrichum camelliae]|nr:hypothetical protein CcaCcLH18_08693 [Colletotrichum camelliae]
MNSQLHQTLCQRCDSLDLDKIFAGNYETPQIVTNLGDIPHDMLSSECPLCRLLADAVHRPFSDESLTSYHDTCYFCNNVDTEASFVQGYTLFADRISSVRWEGIGHSKVTSYFGNVLGTTIHNDGLFIKSDVKNANAAAATPSNGPCSPATADMDVPGDGLIALKVGRMKEGRSIVSYLGSIYPASSSEVEAAAGRLVPPIINWKLLRSFVRTCQDSHEVCRLTKAGLRIAGFCLINCNTGSLELATPEAAYVALSYVWGQPDKSDEFQSSLKSSDGLSSIPLVIRDAMTAVREMGLVYLWVDRYCIKQDDCEILSDHLSKMHVIYRQAAFTIVAAAGHDSAFGLPGVSTRKRQTQAHASIGGRLLVSAIEPYSNDSKTIKWNTRAWTYQEGIFSVRQLMFGTHQVTFRCADSQKCEGLTHPSEVNTSSLRLYGLRSRSAWEHITHYSKRHLTYESDALKAITATLNDYNDKTKDAAFHAWGMPFAANLNVLDGSSPGALRGAIFASEQAIFGYSLAWYPASDNLERRHGFPTWSWSSSRANVGFLKLPYSTPDNALMPDPEINVHFEYLDGQIVSLSEYMSQKPSVQLSHYLHLEAWSVRSNLTFHPDEERVTIDVGDDKYHLAGSIGLESLPDGDDHKPIHDLMKAKDGWEAMVVFFSPENNEGAVQPFIITLMRVEDPEKPDEEVYERIGHVSGLRLEKMPQRRVRMDEAPGKDVLGRDVQNRDVNDSRRTVGCAAKVLDDQARETQEAEEKFGKFREGLKQAGCTSQPSVVTYAEAGVSEGCHLSTEPDLEGEGHVSLSQISGNKDPDDLDDGSHSTDTAGSSEADSDDHGDYTINMVVRRGHIKRLFPRIPMVRKRVVIR